MHGRGLTLRQEQLSRFLQRYALLRSAWNSASTYTNANAASTRAATAISDTHTASSGTGTGTNASATGLHDNAWRDD